MEGHEWSRIVEACRLKRGGEGKEEGGGGGVSCVGVDDFFFFKYALCVARPIYKKKRTNKKIGRRNYVTISM